MATAGKFELKVTGPYPVFASLLFEGEVVVFGIHHSELRDLQHVVETAMRDARVRLGKDADQV